MYDGFVRDGSAAASIDPALIIFSAGNSGASGLTRPKVAKNLIATASSRNTRPELASATNTTNNLQDLSSFSSLGPAADTRVKPDITAPGDTITGGRSGPDVLFGNIDTFHRYSSGTSHASPIVAGAAALFTQFWRNGHSGANPSPALVKAALINGAVDMTGLGAAASIPNGGEGWGRLDISNVLNTGVPTEYVNQTTPLTTVGQIATFSGTVQSATQPLRVSVVWTDPPAVSDPALVNNLDLEVTVGGNTYRGNVFTGGISQTGGVADIRNNVENVFLPAGIPVGTAVTIRVTATGLNGDGILGDADTTDQHFSLVAFNAVFGAAAVIAAAGATITAESCSPANGALDPGEVVTVNFGLRNVGSLNTTNLVATLQATGGVQSPSGPQNYGVVIAGGPAVSRPFTFTVNPMLACGATLTATLQLQDGATNLGTVTFLFTLGTTTVTCTATDGASNTATCSFSVTVNDTQAPSIACPANVTVGNDAGLCSAVVSFTTPTPADNCPGATATCVPASGSTFPVGTTVVTCTATDGASNTATCTFSVTVTDAQAPSIICPPNITVPATQGTACAGAAVVNDPAPTVSDNCGATTTVCVPASGSVFPVGTTTVTCTATDTAGNTATCSFTVTVAIAYDVCILGDGTGDTFSIVVNSASPLYGAWRYRVAATGEVFCGTASQLSYFPGRSLIAADNDDPFLFMNANIGYGTNSGTVRVTHRPTNRQFRLRDQNLANDPPCP